VLAVEAAVVAASVVALKTHTHDMVLTHSGVYQMFLIYFRECVREAGGGGWCEILILNRLKVRREHIPRSFRVLESGGVEIY
jgi:hypothetical protein